MKIIYLLLLLYIAPCLGQKIVKTKSNRKRIETKLDDGTVILSPVMVRNGKVKYPKIAQKAGIEDSVVVEFTIPTNGRPTDIIIISGHPMLNDAAIDATKKYFFLPALTKKDRKPIPVKWRIPFRFRLREMPSAIFKYHRDW